MSKRYMVTWTDTVQYRAFIEIGDDERLGDFDDQAWTTVWEREIAKQNEITDWEWIGTTDRTLDSWDMR